MDRDSSWTDSDGNGLYNSHSSLEIDFYVSRLTGSTLEINFYLNKLHNYRKGAAVGGSKGRDVPAAVSLRTPPLLPLRIKSCKTAGMKKAFLIAAIFLAFGRASIPAQPTGSNPPAPEINASAAILIDPATGTVLYDKNADAVIPPASLTKLMSIHIALNYIKSGATSGGDLVPISTKSDFRNMPPRSSLMFIEEGQRVTLTELLKGLALPSGNDAAVAVAEFIAGGMDNFVEMMNRETEALGLTNTHFADASGLSEKNRTTAREYAAFVQYYLKEHPDAVETLHSLPAFTYPEEHNLPEGGESVYGPINQPNHNLLIGRMEGVDGLKTGYIDESGYNFAAAAEKDGRRLVLVTLGGPGDSTYDGSLRRAFDAAALFSYGFYGWSTYTYPITAARRLRIWGGAADELGISYSPAEPMTIPAIDVGGLVFSTVFDELTYPVEAGTPVGRWHLNTACGKELQSGVILSEETVSRGNFFKRLKDGILRFFRPDK